MEHNHDQTKNSYGVKSIRASAALGEVGAAEAVEVIPIEMLSAEDGSLGIKAEDLRKIADQIADDEVVVWLRALDDPEDLLEHLATLNFVDGAISLVRSSRKLVIDGEEIHIQRTEFNVLELLGVNAGKVVSRDLIYSRLWGGYVNERTLDVYVSSIRRKLGSYRGIIKTHYGLGYLLDDDTQTRSEL